MIFKQLYIDIDRDLVDEVNIKNDYRYSLYKRSRHICNYIERECLRKLRFKSSDFNKIVISLSTIKNEVRLVDKKVLVCYVKFEKDIYDQLVKKIAFSTYFMDIIVHASKKINCTKFEIPEIEIQNSLRELQAKNFNNNWLFKKKKITEQDILVSLNCSLGLEYFHLVLKIENYLNGTIYKEEEILKTDADENAFAYKFKEILIKNQTVSIVDKFGSSLKSVNLTELNIKP